MKPVLISAFIILCSATAASADVGVERHILQKGVFEDPSCTPDTSDPSYDACKCEADIRYPIISGMKDVNVQKALNDSLKQDADKVKCQGAESKKVKGKEPASVTHSYEITFHSPQILAFKFTDWTYSGGAHGGGSVTGVILDLEKGKILTISDLLMKKNLPAVNKVIYAVLSAKPEGEVFHDQIESRKEKFITENECRGCTLMLTPTGLQAVFQIYEIAPYAAGNTQIAIPEKYVSYAPITEALATEKKK